MFFDPPEDDEEAQTDLESRWAVDPAAEWSTAPEEIDPDEIGPSAPTPPDPGAIADRPIVALFWRLVVVFNVAIFALALGPMLVFFEGDYRRGVPVFLVGVVTFAYGLTRYYLFQRGKEGDNRFQRGQESDDTSVRDDAAHEDGAGATDPARSTSEETHRPE